MATRAPFDPVDSLLTAGPFAGRQKPWQRAEDGLMPNLSCVRFGNRETVKVPGRGHTSRPNRLGTPRRRRKEVSSDVEG